MDSSNLTDPTDWHGTRLNTLQQLDALLRCQVCKDFFDNAVITSCAHTFCGICIRRCLSAEGKCPVCRQSEQETKLRRNVTLQEATDAFKGARAELMAVGGELSTDLQHNDTLSRRGSKRKRQAVEDDEGRPAAQILRRSSRRSGQRATSASSQEPSQDHDHESIMIPDDNVKDEDFALEDGLVACPICNRRMKEELVFSHLNICEGSKDTSSLSTRAKSRTPLDTTTLTSSRPPEPPPERLPAINYSMFKEDKLRKKLRDIGIPPWGAKPLLTSRHLEWLALWNSNCDSAHPRAKRELLKELDAWERSQGGHAPLANQGCKQAGHAAANDVMRKDFDGDAWARQHKGGFDDLINRARQQRNVPRQETRPPDEEAREVHDSGQEDIHFPQASPAQPDAMHAAELSQSEVRIETAASHGPPSPPRAPMTDSTSMLAGSEVFHDVKQSLPGLEAQWQNAVAVSQFPHSNSTSQLYAQDFDPPASGQASTNSTAPESPKNGSVGFNADSIPQPHGDTTDLRVPMFERLKESVADADMGGLT